MADTDLERVVAIADKLSLPIPEAWRSSVAANLDRLLEQAALVMAADLPADAEPPADFQP